jgi:uncharacterized protein YbjT (DUF2867 family)
MTKPIFVSGATGNIGREVVLRLLRHGARVRAGARTKESADELERLGAEAVVVDLRDLDSVTAALTGVERALSLSPLVPDQARIGVMFAGAARRAGVEYVVRISSLGAGSDDIALNRWHHEVERALEASGLAYAFVRPTFFMQNYLAFADAVALPHGDAAIAAIDARDVAAVAATVLTDGGHDGQAYELTGPEPLTNHDVVGVLSRLTGRAIEYVDVPDDAARRAMADQGVPPAVAEGLLELAAVIRAGERAAVTDAVERLTGAPPRSFERFAADHRERFLAEAA